MKKLYIVGAGGLGREVLWLVKRINEVNPIWDISGFIDDNEKIRGTKINDYTVWGNCDYLEELKEVWVICAIGAAQIKKCVVDRLTKMRNIRFATLIDPTVVMSDSVSIGEGTIICAGTILTVDITIGKHVTLNAHCTVGHDDFIKDYVTVYPSASISGNVVVDEGAELGTGMQIIQGKQIGAQSIIGAGAVVVNNIPARCTAVGCPAKPIKFFD